MSHSDPNRLLYLTEEQVLQGIELMFFAYKGFTSDPDQILAPLGYGRAHHRAIHFIKRCPGLTVNDLITVLGVSKQSLNRVLREVIDRGLVESRIDPGDRRKRQLHLTEAGRALEADLATAQQARTRAAYSAAGAEAVEGFRQVLEHMIDPDQYAHLQKLRKDRTP